MNIVGIKNDGKRRKIFFKVLSGMLARFKNDSTMAILVCKSKSEKQVDFPWGVSCKINLKF